MFLAALFIVAKKQRELRHAWTDKWINKLSFIHTMEYYSAPKRNEVLSHNMDVPPKHHAEWRKPDIKGYTVYEFHLYEMSRVGKSTEMQSSLGATKGWREGRIGSGCLMGTGFSLG